MQRRRRATSCLTKAQVETARVIYASAVNRGTKREITGLERGSELGWTDLGWTASARATGLDQFRFLVFGDPNWVVQKFNFDSDIVRAEELDNDTINALNPNLKPFLDRGGKLIQYHGWSDPQISPASSTQYYARVLETRRRRCQSARLLSTVHGARHGTLWRRRRTELVRHGHGSRRMGRTGQGARSDSRVAFGRRRDRSDAALVSVPAGRNATREPAAQTKRQTSRVGTSAPAESGRRRKRGIFRDRRFTMYIRASGDKIRAHSGRALLAMLQQARRVPDGYEPYYGFRQTPFGLTPNPRFVFPSSSHERALKTILHASRVAKA